MTIKHALTRLLAVCLALLLALPLQALARQSDTRPLLRQAELDQILAPIALYPDALLAQIFMASTYPLEVVQADRWVKKNAALEGDALTAALEQQAWDPSVKSLVNFPEILAMMSESLDWLTKLGDAFIAQQEGVMATVQKLRGKALAAGHLKSTPEQNVVVEQQVIKIESPTPQVVYVPTYNPAVVYGTWWYPAYPPYVYHYPGYLTGPYVSFGVGVVFGAAWGYAWGGCNWRRHRIDIDINRNIHVNRKIHRGRYRAAMRRRRHIGAHGRGKWHHNPIHRRGVAYRDRATAQRFHRRSSAAAMRVRENFRGRAEAGRRDLRRRRAAPFNGHLHRGRVTTGGRRSRVQSDRARSHQPSSRTIRGDRRRQVQTNRTRSRHPSSRITRDGRTRQFTTRHRSGAFQGVDRARSSRSRMHSRRNGTGFRSRGLRSGGFRSRGFGSDGFSSGGFRGGFRSGGGRR